MSNAEIHNNTEANRTLYIFASDSKLFKKKTGAAKLAYILLLSYFRQHHRFFSIIKEIPEETLETFIANKAQNKAAITIETLRNIFNQSRRISRYKQEIRSYLGVKPFTSSICKQLIMMISPQCLKEYNDAILINIMMDFLKKSYYEYPPRDRFDFILKKARDQEEEALLRKIDRCFSPENKAWIDDTLLCSSESNTINQELKQRVGPFNRQSLQQELYRLSIARELPIASLTFIETIHPKHRNRLKRRFLSDTPERTRRRQEYRRYGLSGLYCYERAQTLTDDCIDHYINLLQQLKQRSKSMEERLIQDLHRGQGLDLLYQIAEINRDNPKEIIEQAVYTIVPQDQIDTVLRMRHMMRSIKTRVKDSLLKRYSRTVRNSCFEILNSFSLHSNNDNFLTALSFIIKHQDGRSEYYPMNVKVPIDNILTVQEKANVIELDHGQEQRVIRKAYEYIILHQLQKRLKHKEVWIAGSLKYRNPDDDLPRDFTNNREEYYQKLGLSLSSETFVEQVKQSMKLKLDTLDKNLSKNSYVKIITKHHKPWIKVSPIVKKTESQNIDYLKRSILQKWGVVDLLDVLKEVDLFENITQGFTTAGNREILSREIIRERLLLSIFAIGTNTGLKRISGASLGKVTHEDLRHIKRFFLNADELRDAIARVVNAIYRVRDPLIWGEATSVCGSDSVQIESYNQNLMTQWHPRYHSSGVMIYWHVNTQSICIYSQLKTCTSSEVAAMLQGLLDHQTDFEVQSHATDSHGKSDLGFALTYLLGFDLLPRYKSLGSQKLYSPAENFKTKHLSSIMTREINWALIETQYDDMVRHTAALKTGTARADVFVRKFSRSNYGHPTFKAFIELGRAIKTIFLCRYLDSLELRQQINSGLNVVENWNSANRFIYYGKSGEFATNSRDEQEISMLCLHLLQVSLTYVNTLFVQDIFSEKHLICQFQTEDFRALTPLFYNHVNPYGSFILDLKKRLNIQNIGKVA